MRNPFRTKTVWNAYGESTEEATGRPFRRVARALCLAAIALVVVGVVLVQWRESRTLDARLARMEQAAARAIGDALDPTQNQSDALRRGQKTMTEWRNSLRSATPQTRRQSDRLLAMYDLEERLLPRWRALLGPQTSDGESIPLDERRRRVRAELLESQEKWGPPPPPAIVFVLTVGSRRFLDGAVGGIIWPYGVVVRGFQAFSGAGESLTLGAKFRQTFFPWKLAAFTAAWLLGFGVMAAAVGYFFCWLGAKADSAVLSWTGLIYFFYIALFVVFIFLLSAGILA